MSTDLEFLDIAQIRGSAFVPSLDHNCNWSRGNAIRDHNHYAGPSSWLAGTSKCVDTGPVKATAIVLWSCVRL